MDYLFHLHGLADEVTEEELGHHTRAHVTQRGQAEEEVGEAEGVPGVQCGDVLRELELGVALKSLHQTGARQPSNICSRRKRKDDKERLKNGASLGRMEQ